MALLSSVMPELTETELRHRGNYIVTHRHPTIGLVASCGSSIDAFIERNDLLDTPGLRKRIHAALGVKGKFEAQLPNGDHVSIQVAFH